MRTNLMIALVAVTVAAAIALATRERIPDSAEVVQTAPAGSVTGSAPAAIALGSDTAAGAATDTASVTAAGDRPAPATAPARSENFTAAPAASADAAAIVRRAADAYREVRSMKADFVQRTHNPLLDQTTSSRGTLYQRRPDLFKLEFSDPAGDVIVSDGRYFWIFYPSVDRKQVMRAPVSAAGAGAVDLQAQFLGDTDRRFAATLEGTEDVNGRRTFVVTMRPRENLGYRSLKVWVDAADHLVRRFEITENNENVRRFDLRNLQINPSLPESIFRFTPPAGARIVERG